MSERLVLIDSSAWITYLLGVATVRERSIEKLLETHRCATNAVVRVELLTGAKDEAQYADLEDTLNGLHLLELTDAVWRRTERLRFELRRAGHLVPVTDAVIACCALVYGCELLHADRHFNEIARVTSVRIHRS